MSYENTILVIGSISIIAIGAMLTMVSYLILRENTSTMNSFIESKKPPVEFKIVTLDPKACQYPGWIGDGICDALNNKQICEFDGGDCNQNCAKPELVADGNCDEENDTPECDEDGQDCFTRKFEILL